MKLDSNKFVVNIDSFATEFDALLKKLGLGYKDREDFVTYWLCDIRRNLQESKYRNCTDGHL